jgi:antitoxin (DNA-binding transcriptional repressor) of toxin-antitoxin stability system
MHSVTTRELIHGIRGVRQSLEAGEPVEWVFRGKKVATLQPVKNSPRPKDNPWIARAQAAGAVLRADKRVSDLIYEDR